ncbi:UPF0481 protein At3g47200-like [Cornus florida]|uniref:UPF0481 protein At3g47200-like n=1 Tax=Cornus florida TaxID=4283 RepID=UPI0028A2A54F|nr:UPF0481 protein At3g47200-like [Cornus florida]
MEIRTGVLNPSDKLTEVAKLQSTRMERIDTANHGLEIEQSTSIDSQDPDVPLANSITEMIDNLSPLSPNCCIYRVPKKYRNINEKAYTPQIVSIGPLHHGKENLQAMEEHKLRYLQVFLNRTRMGMKGCIRVIREWEERARKCYAESIMLSSDEFVKMILLDSSFIIEAIWRYNFFMLKDQTDYLNRPHMIVAVRLDMILLENQLPFFVLEDLFNITFNSYPNTQLSFLMLSINYFKSLMLIKDTHKVISSCEVNHFLDLLRSCHLPSSLRSLPAGSVKFVAVCNTTELKEVGMKFKRGSSNHLLDIQCTMDVLEIPHLCIHDGTEPLLRNLIAFEQCHYTLNSYIMDYVSFMDCLIDTAKDVDILIQNGITENQLSYSSSVSCLFNGLTTEMIWQAQNYYFYGICEDLNAYCRVPWHRWKVTLKRDYFSTPWRIISTIAAVILLCLTLIQAMCSIASLKTK